VIVVDNSVLVAAILENEWSERARAAASQDGDWILPPLWQYEFTNVMVTLTKKRRVTAMAARGAIDDARVLVADRVVAVDQHEVVRLALAFDISGYDAQYAALAQMYGVQCVTNDRRFADRVRALVTYLGEFPGAQDVAR
jgi:predicted nucleic acid-binding protein